MSITQARNVHDSILGAIGWTPMIRLHRIVRDIPAAVFAKIETFNPGNSIKDRMAVKMIEDAERQGLLKPGGTIIEGTSGNTGMGLAIAAIVKGYKCIFTTTDKQSREKVDALRAFGAEVIVCPTDVDPEDPRSYYSVSSRLVAETPNAWKANQYDNLSNSQAHYETTGPEIWEQTGGVIGAFVASQGSGGTLTGAGRYLRERDSRVRLYAVEPEECALLARREWGPHGIEGIGDGFIPDNLDVSQLSGVITTTTDESLVMARRLAAEEGIFCGISTGCNVAAALKLARHRPDLPSIVTMANDTGQRYFTTALCGEDKKVDVPEREHPMDRKTQRELDRYQSAWEILT